MAQFQHYSSADVSHPVLAGNTSGSLLSLLNSCLITGYGSKPGAGWSKTGSVAPSAGLAIPDSASCGIFVMPTGSAATLFIWDSAPAVCGLRQARASGYDSIQAFTASVTGSTSSAYTASVTGVNPFPTVAQGLGTAIAAIGVRKSTDVASTERQWVLFADSSSMYLFVLTGDAAGYSGFAFGDIFSIKSGSADTYRCIIVGNIAEIVAGTTTNERLDALSSATAVVTGHFMQRSYTGGVTTSTTVGKHGDSVKGLSTFLAGSLLYPNTPDTGLYLSPVWVTEGTTGIVRGRMRGFYQICHPTTSFSDGQTITGAGDFAGKTFYIVKPSFDGMYCIETSDTLETN